jgi:hypothetical protein
MFPGRHHHLTQLKDMVVPVHAQSSPNDLPTDNETGRLPGSFPQFADDETTTMVYEPFPSPATILRASQVALQPGPPTLARLTPPTRVSDRELAFIVTAALFGTGVLLLAASIAHLLRTRRRGRLTTSRSAACLEQGLRVPKDFDDSTWGMAAGGKGSSFQEHFSETPHPPTASTLRPHLSHPIETPRPNTELTAALEQFEQRLYQEETDIALALHIAFGDESSATQHCAPFFRGSEDDVATMLSLQAGMESVGKRSGGIRNRARQGSDASASSQSTTVTVEGFSSHSSSMSSLTSFESMISDVEESSVEAEDDVVYEVKRAQTRSMEIQKGTLITWQPGGVRLMVTGPSTMTLGTASVDLDEFPLPPVDAY